VRELWLLRHAETEWSLAGRHTGRTDIPLTAAGRAHAERLAPWIGAREWAAVLCSPLSRARETAALAGVGPRAVLREDLLEVDYGEVEGITTDAFRERVPGWTLWTHGAPGGETLAQVGERVDRVIAEAVATPGDGDVLCVAHGHVLRILAASWLGLGPQAGAHLALVTGAVCVLGFERDTRVLWRWNDTVR
jgi:probable phosphoglycerate mutase